MPDPQASRRGETRVVVLGGSGNFGARIVRALASEAGTQVIAASRNGAAVAGAAGVATLAVDAFADDLAVKLRERAADVVIHTVGPFQGQDYRVAEAALAAGAHYLDLADGRDFVCQFAAAMHAQALAAGRVAISGASTLPALSSAVVDSLVKPMRTIERIEIAIAPGQRAIRGVATLKAVLSYLGRPINVWKNGLWVRRHGWMDLARVPLAIGSRWGALCDVPDLELLPARYPEVRSVSFHAALEFRLQHLALWLLAALRRIGLPLAVDRWAIALDHVSGSFDAWAGPWGGMRVCVTGRSASHERLRRTWQVVAPAADGPEIPTFAALLLTRKIAQGQLPACGARACLGELPLDEFDAEFQRWGMSTAVDTVEQ